LKSSCRTAGNLSTPDHRSRSTWVCRTLTIYQDRVDQHGFAASYNSVKRFVAKLRHKEPEQFDRLSFLPGEEMQVDYCEGAPTRVLGQDRWRKLRLFVASLRYSRACFRYVIWKSCQQAWAELHERAFRHLEGVNHKPPKFPPLQIQPVEQRV
jgi:transposase